MLCVKVDTLSFQGRLLWPKIPTLGIKGSKNDEILGAMEETVLELRAAVSKALDVATAKLKATKLQT